jgi:dephospho-CoA kinase
MMIIGLTGGIASGKSTVSKIIMELGLPVVDADLIAREVVGNGQPAYHKIVDAFGEKVIDHEGNLNRELLGSIVFNDEQKRQQLNGIVHPEVRKMMLQKAEHYIESGAEHVVLDIPLLFESKLTHMVEKVLLVYVDFEIQLARLITRNSLSKDEALVRIKSQMPLKEKISLADEVINNNGSLSETKEQLITVLNRWNVLEAHA